MKEPRPVVLVELEHDGVVARRQVEGDHVVVVPLGAGLVARQDGLAVDEHAHAVVDAAYQSAALGAPVGVADP